MAYPPAPENWRPVAQSDKYLVSRTGEVWSVLSGKVLCSKKSKTGYRLITLKQQTGTFYLHDLVATAWLGNSPSPDHVVDHLDHDKTHNHVSNLEWVTREENARRAAAFGALKERKRGRKQSLTSEQVYSARQRRLNGEAVAIIAAEFGVDLETVRSAVHGKTYKDFVDVAPLPLIREPWTWRPGSGGKRREGPAKATDDPPTTFIEPISGEDWRRLSGDLSGYWVSSKGRIFSAKSRRLMQPQTTKMGYLRIQLRTPMGHQNKMVHVLVAENFLESRPKGLIAGHLNENPQDPRLTNLAWISRRENAVRSHVAQLRTVEVLALQDLLMKHVETERCVDFKRKDGTPISVDAFIPSLKTAIIYENIEQISESNGVGRLARVQDNDTLSDLGLRVLRVHSIEWKEKNDLVRSVLLHKIGKTGTTKVYARQTEVRDVPPSVAMGFLEENHLQGAVGSTARYGCYSAGELVALMTFGPQRYGHDAAGSYELLRYANRKGHSVIGGFSKLLAHFLGQHEVTRLVSFADRRWSSGNVYEQSGFKLARVAAPNYFYFKAPDLTLRSRVQFQKHKLPALLTTFDPAKTEVENMVANGWDRIWDCGNLVYEMDPAKPK